MNDSESETKERIDIEYEITFKEDFLTNGREQRQFYKGNRAYTHLSPSATSIEIAGFGYVPLSIVDIRKFKVTTIIITTKLKEEVPYGV